jgi:hypothetical protein
MAMALHKPGRDIIRTSLGMCGSPQGRDTLFYSCDTI